MQSRAHAVPQTLRARERTGRFLGLAAHVFVAACALLTLAVFGLGLEIVDTPSVPIGLYVRHRLGDRPIERGEYVCFEAWRTTAPALLRVALERGAVPVAWGQSERLTKRVGAVAGDRVDYVHERVTVNGVPLASSAALAVTSRGVVLPKPTYPMVLGADEVWLSSEHERGFDSRYFGPVKRAALSCRAELLWQWR